MPCTSFSLPYLREMSILKSTSIAYFSAVYVLNWGFWSKIKKAHKEPWLRFLGIKLDTEKLKASLPSNKLLKAQDWIALVLFYLFFIYNIYVQLYNYDGPSIIFFLIFLKMFNQLTFFLSIVFKLSYRLRCFSRIGLWTTCSLNSDFYFYRYQLSGNFPSLSIFFIPLCCPFRSSFLIFCLCRC